MPTDPTTPPRSSSSPLTRPLRNGAAGAGEGVDRRVARRRFTPARLGLGLAALGLAALLAWGLFGTRGHRLQVDADGLTIATVERGPFQEYVAQTGNVQPRTTVYLDAVEGGRVEEVFVREGTVVEAGQPLLRLSNNDLQLRLLAADAQLVEQTNRLQDIRFRMEQNALGLRQQLAEMDYQIQRLERQHARNEELRAKQLIAAQTYEETQDELAYYRRNRALTLQGFRQDSLRMTSQIAQMRASVASMQRNYQTVQTILEDLTVRAPVAGHLTALDAEVGELRRSGDRFGQIDKLDGYKVRAGVDEFYIARVQRGTEATTLPIGGTTYPLRVTRVYPEVRDGRFEVDLAFADTPPEGVRRGQTIRFRLELGQAAEAVLLPRGGFYGSTGGRWVYILTSDGEAVRRPVELGRQNPQYLEVLSGLTPGDRVVTSSYETFGDADRLVLE